MRAAQLTKPVAKKVKSFGEVSTDDSSPFESPEELDGTDYNLEFSRHPPKCSTFQKALSVQNQTKISCRKGEPPISSSQKAQMPQKSKKTSSVFNKAPKTLGQLDMFDETPRNLIPRLPFSRLVREIIFECSDQVTMITAEAMDGLQCATEVYASQRLQDAYLLTLHRGRATLTKKDLELLNMIKAII